VKEDYITVDSSSVWGILRGLETFSQLLWINSRKQVNTYEQEITDFPRFSHRGILLDTARHFIPKRTILQNLDAMSYNKMNVLHWHIVDDQSFPYYSKTFPQLSFKGAYDPYNMVYKPDDVKEIIEYARMRGIRIIPEFDTPSHSFSWGKAFPDLLSTCLQNGEKVFGPMNPVEQKTFVFLDKFIEELREVFKDEFLHLGGDEVDLKCWKANSKITEYMRKNKIRFTEDLVNLYMGRMLSISKRRGFRPIVWHETFQYGLGVCCSFYCLIRFVRVHFVII